MIAWPWLLVAFAVGILVGMVLLGWCIIAADERAGKAFDRRQRERIAGKALS